MVEKVPINDTKSLTSDFASRKVHPNLAHFNYCVSHVAITLLSCGSDDVTFDEVGKHTIYLLVITQVLPIVISGNLASEVGQYFLARVVDGLHLEEVGHRIRLLYVIGWNSVFKSFFLLEVLYRFLESTLFRKVLQCAFESNPFNILQVFASSHYASQHKIALS